MNSAQILPWSEQLATGLPQVDAEHRRLVEIINELGGLQQRGATGAELQAVLGELRQYASYHFENEASLMRSHALSAASRDSHLAAHQGFVGHLDRVIGLVAAPGAVVEHLLAFMVRWLVQHIAGMDARMAREIAALQAGAPAGEAPAQNGAVYDSLIDSVSALYDNLGARTLELLETNQRLQAEIARRQSVEAALEFEAARFRDLTEMSSSWYWEQDEHLRFTFVSQGVRDYAGQDQTAYVGKTRWDLPGRNWSADERQAHRQLLESHQPFSNLELSREDQRGELRWASLSGRPWFDAAGNFRGYRGVGIDITRRRIAEDNETMQRHALELLARGAPLADILAAIARHAEAANPGILCSILLLDEGGRHLLTAAAPSLPQSFTAAIHGAEIGPNAGSCGSAAYSGERVIVEDIRTHALWQRFRKPALDAGLLACWAEPIRSPSGKVLGTFANYCREAGAPSRASLASIENASRIAGIGIERSRAEAALRASEERWMFALEGGGDGVWDRNIQTGEIVYSRRYKEMLGYAEDEFENRREEWDRRIHAEDKARVMAELQAYLDGKSPEYATEFRMQCKDGSWKWILARGMVGRRDAEGRPLRIIGTHSDVTKRKQAEAARRELEAQLRESQKMEAIGTLAGGVAHDFNNILAAILGNAALAKKDVAAGRPAAALVSLDEIDKAGGRGRTLVQQILAFSRRQPQDFRVQALRPLVEEALRLLRATLPAGVEIGIALADAPLDVRADATQIGQVLMNLCTNAWHALEGRSGRIEVGLVEVLVDAGRGRQVDGVASGRYARIRVSDDGCGMDEATQARIFEPFYTTKSVDQGTGLGLAVVHGIVKAHQGAIMVQSAPGKGTRVDVYLPLAQVSAETALPVREAPAASGGEGKHVLYVDDDEAMVFLVRRMLEDLGYRVSGFLRGEAALAAVQGDAADFDLVVTDFNMPGLSGLQVAEELARLRPGLPVVVTSGYITEELATGARAAGVRKLVYKPNTADELCATIRRLLATTGA